MHCRECITENKAREYGRETNIAQGEAKCYIWLKTTPECFIYRNAQAVQCMDWFKVLSTRSFRPYTITFN